MSNPDRTPYATRHLPDFYRIAAALTADDTYLAESRTAFIARGMQLAAGKANPQLLSDLYSALMGDAGLAPYYTPSPLGGVIENQAVPHVVARADLED